MCHMVLPSFEPPSWFSVYIHTNAMILYLSEIAKLSKLTTSCRQIRPYLTQELISYRLTLQRHHTTIHPVYVWCVPLCVVQRCIHRYLGIASPTQKKYSYCDRIYQNCQLNDAPSKVCTCISSDTQLDIFFYKPFLSWEQPPICGKILKPHQLWSYW